MAGVSGSGKSSRANQIELKEAENGATVIIIDINRSHSNEMIYPPIWEEYRSRMNRIDAKRDGVNIEFLRPMREEDGQIEDMVTLINSATCALGSMQKLGSCQIGALREAIIFALSHREEFPDEMTAIGVGLLQQEGTTAKGVYQKLWTVINSRVFRRSNKYIKRGAINLVSFIGLDKLTQATLVEVLLFSLWRIIQYQRRPFGNKVVLALDEFQNLSLREGSILRDLLREGRKFGVYLLLTTQSRKVFPKDTLAILDQVGTKLFFRPAMSEVRSIAKEIAPDEVAKWERILSSLQIGEAVAVGNLSLGEMEISHPVLTK